MKRFYIIFEGQVQGVGFRYTISTLAAKHNLTGWVKNRYDERVECEIQGDENAITNLINEIYHASRWIFIENYVSKEIPVISNEKGFSVKYY